MDGKIKLLVIHSLPLMLGFVVSGFLWRSNILLLGIYIVVIILLILVGKDRKTEIYIQIYGMVAGFVIEAIGTSISGYQSFTNPDFFGIPYWLPVVWGYGFIVMKRIALIISTGSPWASQVKIYGGQ